jgi:hypothetical protein
LEIQNANLPIVNLYKTGIGTWSIGGDTTAPTSNKFNIGYNSVSPWFTIDNSGNIGVGTTAPIAKLDVQGGIHFIAATAANPSGVKYGSDTSNSTYNYSYTTNMGTYLNNHYGMTIVPVTGAYQTNISGYGGVALQTSGNDRLFVTQGGNVGIGKVNPLEKLDVLGVIRTGNASSVRGSIMMVDNYGSAADGNISVYGTEYVTGASIIGYSVKPSSSAVGSFLASNPYGTERAALVVGAGSYGNGEINFLTAPASAAAIGGGGEI